MFKNILLILSFINVQHIVFAQKIQFKGMVKDTLGVVLKGVSIVSSKTGAGSLSDSNGNFTIQAEPSDLIVFSIIGYKSKIVGIKNTDSLIVILQPSQEDLDQVVVVGSRSGGRVKTETPVPVDLIKLNDLGLLDAKINLTSILNIAAPSFNYNKQSGSDGADHIDLGSLRGLGPDQTLVLLNGKRRHQTAFIGLFGTRGRGNSGTDLNGFPENAVERVEILRDGASAQYGSDAMAGVINIVLKKNTGKWNIDQGYSFYHDKKYNALNAIDASQYYTGKIIDGRTYAFSADNGWNLGKKGGNIHLSVNYLNKGRTFRQVPDTNVIRNPEAYPVNKTRRAFGESTLQSWGSFINLNLPLWNQKGTLYSFGGVSHKFGDSYAFTRNASQRPDRFPVDNNGVVIFVPSIMKKTSDGEIFYNPHNQAKIIDASLAFGIKGSLSNGWKWDISNSFGFNDFHFYGDKTFNPSLINRPDYIKFDDGGLRYMLNTVNFDLNRTFKVAEKSIALALGSEYKFEQYSVYAGEEASYKGYPNRFGQSAGAQGFPGFSIADEITGKRQAFSVFADAEIDLTKKFLVGAAARVEHFSDFGIVSTGKLATRLKLGSYLNWRASVSSGFRAPSLQQIYFNNTITSYSFGKLVQSRIASNVDPISKAAGIPRLKEEKSINFSTGFAAKIGEGLRFSIDGYVIKLYNRVVLSGLFSANDYTLPASFTDQLKLIDVSTAQFFANAVNTTNLGLDFVLNYEKKWAKKAIKLSFNGNFNHVSIDKINIPEILNDSYLHRKSFFSDREEQFLKASAPSSKLVMGADFKTGKWTFGLREVFYGSLKTLGFGWTGLASKAGTNGPGDPAISGSSRGIDPYVDIDGFKDQVNVLPEIFNYGAKATTDIYGNVSVARWINLGFGIDNLFNIHPDFAAVSRARYETFANETGGPWEAVQMGFNGTRYYFKLKLAF